MEKLFTYEELSTSNYKGGKSKINRDMPQKNGLPERRRKVMEGKIDLTVGTGKIDLTGGWKVKLN